MNLYQEFFTYNYGNIFGSNMTLKRDFISFRYFPSELYYTLAAIYIKCKTKIYMSIYIYIYIYKHIANL